jgi:large subunit ribosomal protein L46
VSPQYREVDALSNVEGAENDRADASAAADDPLVVSAKTLPADVTGDRRTSARALSERMYLLVKARDSLEPKRLIWQFPTVRFRESRPSKEEGAPPVPMTMRRTLIDGLINYVGSDVSAYPVGNAPVAHLCFELPPQQQQKYDTFGKKVFFYRIQYLGGDLALNRKRIADFAWVTKDELQDYFPKSTVRSQNTKSSRALSISPHNCNAIRSDRVYGGYMCALVGCVRHEE